MTCLPVFGLYVEIPEHEHQHTHKQLVVRRFRTHSMDPWNQMPASFVCLTGCLRRKISRKMAQTAADLKSTKEGKDPKAEGRGDIWDLELAEPWSGTKGKPKEKLTI